jgi:hypothetical protein
MTFSASSFVSFFLTMVLVVIDRRNGGRLNASAAERQLMIKNDLDNAKQINNSDAPLQQLVD